VKERPFNIREWELSNPKTFLSEQGRGRGFIQMPIPMEFSVGDYLLVRDVHFLYKNTYQNQLACLVEERVGLMKHHAKIGSTRKLTSQGAAYFIDVIVKPKKGYTYWLNMPEIPFISHDYGLFYKVHFRLVNREEFQGFNPELTEFLQNRVITF